MSVILNPSFTRGEFWLLNAVLEFRLEIFRLATDDLTLLINEQHFDVPLSQIAQDLMSLYERGLIGVVVCDSTCKEEQIKLTIDLIHSLFSDVEDERHKEKPALYYFLTEKEGQYWEAFTKPHWQYYMLNTIEFLDCQDWQDSDQNYYFKGRVSVELACQKKSLLDDYLNNFCEGAIDESTIVFSKADKFEMTYWKTLNNVYLLTFEYTEEADGSITEEQSIKKNLAQLETFSNRKAWCRWC